VPVAHRGALKVALQTRGLGSRRTGPHPRLIAGYIKADLLTLWFGPAALRTKLRPRIQLFSAVWTELRHKRMPFDLNGS
jgi:hypothetical protein